MRNAHTSITRIDRSDRRDRIGREDLYQRGDRDPGFFDGERFAKDDPRARGESRERAEQSRIDDRAHARGGAWRRDPRDRDFQDTDDRPVRTRARR